MHSLPHESESPNISDFQQINMQPQTHFFQSTRSNDNSVILLDKNFESQKIRSEIQK